MRKEFDQLPQALVCYTNIAAVSLSWNTNIAALTSFENAPLLWLARLAFCTLQLKIYNFSVTKTLFVFYCFISVFDCFISVLNCCHGTYAYMHDYK